MDPQQLIAQGRALIVAELNIGHLPQAEQDAIVDGLGEVLLRRVLSKMFELVPETERDNLQKLLKEQNGEAAQALIQKHVPNMDDFVRAEIRAGIDEHKHLVLEEVARVGAS